MRMDTRMRTEEKVEELKLQTLNLFPERWNVLYNRPETLVKTSIFGDQPELPVTNTDQLTQWYDGIGEQRGVSAGDLDRLLGSPGGGDAGRRV